MTSTSESASAPQQDSAAYHRTGRVLTVAGYLVDLALLVTVLFTGWSASLRTLAERVRPEPALSLLVYALLLGLIMKAVSIPFDYAAGFHLEHRYGLSKQTLGAWMKDELKGMLVGGALATIALEFLYWTLRASPDRWWLITGCIFSAFFVVMANLAPVLLLPIFFKLTPLANPTLEARLARLAERAATRVRGVFEWKLGEKTRKANAALTGLGNTRRILLADTLLEGFSEEEIEAVLAHEFGHHVHADIWRGLAVQTGATFAGLYAVNLALRRWSGPLGFRGVADFANLPLVTLVALGVSLVLLPVVNSLARSWERAADLYAIRSIAAPAAMASALERLAALNLAERRPHPAIEFLFHSHPSIESRIAFIRRFATSA